MARRPRASPGTSRGTLPPVLVPPRVGRHRPSAAVPHRPSPLDPCRRRCRSTRAIGPLLASPPSKRLRDGDGDVVVPALAFVAIFRAWRSVATFHCRHRRTPGRASPANETARSPGAVRVRPRRPRRGSSSSWSSPSVTVGQSAYVDGGVVSCRVRRREGGYSP